MTQRNNRAQVTIWIIVAIMIVASIIVLFMIGKQSPQPSFEEITNPRLAIETCTRRAVGAALEKMMPQGGFIAPKNYKLYKNTNVSYLCENIGYFEPCVNQHPLLLTEVGIELENVIRPEIDNCFLDLKDELEQRQGIVSLKPMALNVSFGPGRVRVSVRREMDITERGQSQTFSDFTTDLTHPAYDLIRVAQEIASQEAKYCYFEYVGYMALYPQFDIRKFALSDSTKIYTIADVTTKHTMNIAVRGCALPGGV